MTLSRARFGTAAGGVTGVDHLRAGRDGQDGCAVIAEPTLVAAIVTDGCSSGRASEVGARLGARWLARLVARHFGRTAPEEAARRVTCGLVEQLDALARSLGDGAIDPNVVDELLLFGFLAAVVTDDHAIVFGVGDGIAFVDGRAIVVDPGPENAPTYPAYALLGASIEPNVLHLGPAEDVTLLAIATDGAEPLLAPAGEPSFDALVRDERLLRNPSLLRKRLTVLAERRRFHDDTTIGIVGRLA